MNRFAAFSNSASAANLSSLGSSDDSFDSSRRSMGRGGRGSRGTSVESEKQKAIQVTKEFVKPNGPPRASREPTAASVRTPQAAAAAATEAAGNPTDVQGTLLSGQPNLKVSGRSCCNRRSRLAVSRPWMTFSLETDSSLQSEEVGNLTKPLLDEFLHNMDQKEAVRCVAEKFHPSTMGLFVECVINSVLERSPETRALVSYFT